MVVFAGVVVPRRGKINQAREVTANFRERSTQQVAVCLFHRHHFVRNIHIRNFVSTLARSRASSPFPLAAMHAPLPPPSAWTPLGMIPATLSPVARASAQNAPTLAATAVRLFEPLPTESSRRPSTSEIAPKY